MTGTDRRHLPEQRLAHYHRMSTAGSAQAVQGTSTRFGPGPREDR
jgi:hypothetical protein